MKISHRDNYLFKNDRKPKQSASDFVSVYLPASHAEFVIKCAEELNLTVEDATAYAMAMFNSIQDLFFFHMNFSISGMEVTTIRKDIPCYSDISTIENNKKVEKIREMLIEPYFKSRDKCYTRVAAHLKLLADNKEKMDDSGDRIKDKKKEVAERIERRKKSIKKAQAKAKRIRKLKRKKYSY